MYSLIPTTATLYADSISSNPRPPLRLLMYSLNRNIIFALRHHLLQCFPPSAVTSTDSFLVSTRTDKFLIPCLYGDGKLACSFKAEDEYPSPASFRKCLVKVDSWYSLQNPEKGKKIFPSRKGLHTVVLSIGQHRFPNSFPLSDGVITFIRYIDVFTSNSVF